EQHAQGGQIQVRGVGLDPGQAAPGGRGGDGLTGSGVEDAQHGPSVGARTPVRRHLASIPGTVAGSGGGNPQLAGAVARTGVSPRSPRRRAVYDDEATIRRILTELGDTWAVVGLSTNRRRAAYGVAQVLQKYGKRIVPVHPKAETVHGERGYASLADIPF